MTLTFDTSSRASQGARRYQEDACVFARLHVRSAAPSDPLASTVPVALSSIGVIAVLADGMGGHVGGERASNTACRGFITAMSDVAGDPADHLQMALMAANAAIRGEVAIDHALFGMGCTLIGAVIGLGGLKWVSVGDSRLFLLRAGELYQLNEDHSLAPLLDEMVAQGKMTEAEAEGHPRRHHLRSALTGDAIELMDLAEESVGLQPGDCIVLASDGIDTLPPDAIADAIEANIARGADAVASALIATVDGAGRPGQDNTTVMAIVVRDR